MLWQRGLPLIPNVQTKLRKAANELVEKKLNLEEWYNTVTKIIQNHYESMKTAPPSVSQAFAMTPAGSCPCCGSNETIAQEAADVAAHSIDISSMSADQINEADAAVAQKFGVDFVQRCDACGCTGHISLNCLNRCCFCKVKLNKGTGTIKHLATCPNTHQGRAVAEARAGAQAQPTACYSKRLTTLRLKTMSPMSHQPASLPP